MVWSAVPVGEKESSLLSWLHPSGDDDGGGMDGGEAEGREANELVIGWRSTQPNKKASRIFQCTYVKTPITIVKSTLLEWRALKYAICVVGS